MGRSSIQRLAGFFLIGAFACGGAALSLWIGIASGNPEGYLLDVGQGAAIGGLAGWMILGGINRPSWWPSEQARARLRQDEDDR